MNKQNSSPQQDLFEAKQGKSVKSQAVSVQHDESVTRLGIGIDYGTSNSTAAIFDGTTVTMVPLELGTVDLGSMDKPTAQAVMPSASYVDRQFKISTGQQAIDDFIRSNMGRRVELSAEILGEGRSSTGQLGEKGLPEEASTSKIYGQSFVDSGLKGRLFRGVKRLLGSSSISRLMVFDRPFRLVALITPLLLRIRQATQTLVTQAKPPLDRDNCNHVCIGHPVNFEGIDEHRNQQAIGLLAESYRYAGFDTRSYYPEPIAAALSYLHSNPSDAEETLLAVDFGGGTLDFCIIKRQGSDFEVISTHGVGLGGDHIDQCLFKKLIFPLLGKGERWKRRGTHREIDTLFPFEDYEELVLNWAVSYMLNQNEYTTPVKHRMEQTDPAAIKFTRLYELIKRNYSYLVFQSLKELKAQLSQHTSARLDIAEIDIEIELSRDEFEIIISDILEKFEKALHDCLNKTGLQAKDIDLVIRTGGSSLIPAVRSILDDLFPGKVVEHDPFTSVAAGLAIAEYHNLGFRSEVQKT